VRLSHPLDPPVQHRGINLGQLHPYSDASVVARCRGVAVVFENGGQSRHSSRKGQGSIANKGIAQNSYSGLDDRLSQNGLDWPYYGLAGVTPLELLQHFLGAVW
jgi:hypothetical protein